MAQTPQVSRRIPDADIAEANKQLDRVFALLGLVADGRPVCPACGTNKKAKVVFKQSKQGGHYWRCYRCGEHGQGIALYQERSGVTFPQAVNAILGRVEVPSSARGVQLPKVEIAPSFTAVNDLELYDAVLGMGNLRAAQDYWATWHIAPTAVAEATSRVVTNAPALEKHLIRKFGEERLIMAGLAVRDGRTDRLRFLVNRQYPVIEPQIRPDGHVSAMQFRPSPDQRVKVEAHKDYKRDHPCEESGPRYVTPFLSPKGAQPETLIGYGLHRISQITERTQVCVVEGLKDWMAARTLRPSVEVYAIPGTSVMPPAIALEVLARHDVVVILDGDEAGAAGREKLVSYLRDNGVRARPVSRVPEGLDMADRLVLRHARNGCACETCAKFRRTHQRPAAA